MNKIRLHLKVLLFAVIVAVAGCLVSCGPSASYRKFVRQNQSYYSRVADGCEKLRAHGPALGVAAAEKLAADVESQSPEIRELHPELIFVDTNGVQMQIGQGQSSYLIGWVRSEDGVSWNLDVSSEGIGRIVYTRQKK